MEDLVRGVGDHHLGRDDPLGVEEFLGDALVGNGLGGVSVPKELERFGGRGAIVACILYGSPEVVDEAGDVR